MAGSRGQHGQDDPGEENEGGTRCRDLGVARWCEHRERDRQGVGRKAEQWNNLCCDFGGALNVNLHVGGDGGTPTEVLTKKVILVELLKVTPTDKGKQGIVTDGYRKAHAKR